jgi:diaminohydroxyphosphoribosylaminopyrimidine deaminase / 5-amino-6-(5-phosphoribosylamino)uracil reductase
MATGRAEEPVGEPQPAWIPGSPDADRHWLTAAIELSQLCPPSDTAFSVGAVLVSAEGQLIATGYSRELHPRDHAEEVAIARATGSVPRTDRGAEWQSGTDAALAGATLYSSLEPCLARLSRAVPCAKLTVAAGIRRVVIAWHEPPVFVPGGGAAWLREHDVEVAEFPDLADQARAPSRHLLGG